VEKVSEMVAARAHEKGLALRVEIASDVPVALVGDPTRLRQVLLNLLGNAIKFTESGAVTLRVGRDDDLAVPAALRFTVSDTGIGIPSEKLTRVFERFTQADSSTTRRFGGSGLGLTISRRLVELMGGRIWAESTVNVGSVFSFAVPFELLVGDLRLVTAPINARPAFPLPPLRILLVEDSIDNCTITVAYLAETPYVVEVAANGAIACVMFKAGRYDLVLMDRQMPVMDGLTATRAIRQWESLNQRPVTPIIALTASALKGDREQCLSAGCTAFLTKPIRQDVLLHAIAQHASVQHANVQHAGVARAATREERIQALEMIVPTNPQIVERIPTFLQNRRNDVVAMLDALTRDDYKTVERLGHNMRGTGASYGFQAITDLGAAIEEEAGNVDASASRHWVDELSVYLRKLEQSSSV
jgi:CheY-like chemotaxis protein/HPt (histidine-containing phosphotransfer) domain-containing protein